jgi:nucleotide-binding universal stress UspA family protein
MSIPVVVVGIDGSNTSWEAFWWACGEGRRLGGRLVAVFVSSTPLVDAAAAAAAALTGVVMVPVANAQRDTYHAEHLRGRVEKCAADADLAVLFVHAQGDAANELLEVAWAQHADLIVVGRSTKARHHIVGSLSRRLVGRRDVPVVVVVP